MLWEHKNGMGTWCFYQGALGRMAGTWWPRRMGQGGGLRHPPTAREGSSGFRQRQKGKSSQTVASSVPEPPRGPRHLAEKGAQVLGKLKIDLRLF